MKGNEVWPSKPTATSLSLPLLRLEVIAYAMANINVCGIFCVSWNNFIPCLWNRHSHKGEYWSDEVIETNVVVVDEFVFFYIFEEFKTDGSIEEEKGEDKFNDLSTLWENVNDGIQVGLAPRILQKN